MKLALVVCLILLFGTLIQVNPFVKAETNSLSFSSGLTVFSPLNQTYTSNVIPLNVTFNWGAGLQIFLNYSIDGSFVGELPLGFGNTTGFQQTYLAYGLVDLPKLSNGSHLLTVNVEAKLNGYQGANPPSAPFKPTTSNGTDYVAYWVNEVYFSISTSQLTTNPTPTSTPAIPEFPALVILPLFLSVFAIAVILRHRKTSNLGK